MISADVSELERICMIMHKTSPLNVVIGLGKTGLSLVRHLVKQGCDNIAVIDSREDPPALEGFRDSFSDIPVYLGSLDQDVLKQADELVVTSGLPLSTPQIAEQTARGIPAIGDIELFARCAKAPIIAITGSNGKSTTTSFVGEMAKCAGIDVRVGGNLGTPALELLGDTEPELYVLEISNFQLEKTYSLKARAATILNITENHLDYHATMAEYIEAKKRIYNGCKVAVINRREPLYFGSKAFPERICSFGLDQPSQGNYGLITTEESEFFACGDECLFPVKDMHLKGRHNVANALAAMVLSESVGISKEAMHQGLQSFAGLTHRCQFVREKNGVNWYNDSKGTTVVATIAGLNGFGPEIAGKIVWIAGGIGKGADFLPFREPVKKYVSHAILIGRDAGQIADALDESTPVHRPNTFEEAICLANQVAEKNDIVLLSPACSSFDMFNNFMHRGDEFIRLVQAL
jgi:UDP-N-acetylmuramoylalanine--D-glutamate ligase